MEDLIIVEGVKKAIFGLGAVGKLAAEAESLGAARPLLIMDRALSGTNTGVRVQDIMQRGGLKTVKYFEVTPEPSPEIADRGVALAAKEKVDCVIGVGGGSTMDVAKAVAVLVKNGGNALDYVGLGLVKNPGLPTIMVPTTAGTGSEATFTSVFTMRENRAKGGINSPFLYPNTAILDPELLLDLPPLVSAYTGMDALTHAIESFTSLKAHFMSEPISLKAVELISASLRASISNGEDIRSRANMLQASYLAGTSLAMSGVGAVHALAYPLGAFFDIPHGLANAVMLPYVLEYNYLSNVSKFVTLAKVMGMERNGRSDRAFAALVVDAVRALSKDIGIPLTLKELDVPEHAIPEMAISAMGVTRPILNNPRPMTKDVAHNIYQKAMSGC